MTEINKFDEINKILGYDPNVLDDQTKSPEEIAKIRSEKEEKATGAFFLFLGLDLAQARDLPEAFEKAKKSTKDLIGRQRQIDEDEKDDKELLIDEDDKEGTLIQE